MSDNHNVDLLKNIVLRACDELLRYKKNGKCNVNMWWWNSWAKDEIQKKREAYMEMTKNPTDETKNEYRRRLKKSCQESSCWSYEGRSCEKD